MIKGNSYLTEEKFIGIFLINIFRGVRDQITLLMLIISIVLSIDNCYSQDTKSVPNRQSASEAFSSGNYEQAFTDFSLLLKAYSKDPLYKYYSGVCLIKLKRDPEKAITLLKESLQYSSSVRSIPEDALFYLGRGQQMSGKYADAIGSYNLYTEHIGKKKARAQDVPVFIQQCNESKGELTASETTDDKTKTAGMTKVILIAAGSEKNGNNSLPGKNGNPAKEYVSPEYEKVIDEAVYFQYKADSLLNQAGEHKKELAEAEINEKTALRSEIADNEMMAASFQKSADQKYKEAEELINSKPKPYNNSELVVAAVASEQSIAVQSGDEILKQTDNNTVNSTTVQPEGKKIVETYAFFEVMQKPVVDPKQIIEIDPKVPEGLIYRIQIAVFRNPVAPSYFKGITPVYGFKVTGSENKTYYAGMFRRFSDARAALDEVKMKGFRDAFIVSFSGGKIVSADRAEVLEKEWGKRPFLSTVMSAPEIAADTIPPTLSYRVEVIRSLKPVKEDVVEEIKRMAGNRGLDIQTLDDGKFAYLVGKFITFESAAAYADLLVRNGYRDAHVVAWLGKKELPIDVARKLFDDLE
jgi:tetratricopeptide (TPR) repeat protein